MENSSPCQGEGGEWIGGAKKERFPHFLFHGACCGENGHRCGSGPCLCEECEACIRAAWCVSSGGGGDQRTGCTAPEECVQPGGTSVKLSPPSSAPLSSLPSLSCPRSALSARHLPPETGQQSDTARGRSLNGDRDTKGGQENRPGVRDIVFGGRMLSLSLCLSRRTQILPSGFPRNP